MFSCKSKSTSEPNTTKERNENSITKKYFLKHEGYKMEYLYDWKIDSTAEDFDINSNFSIDSPDGASALFLIFNTPIDIKEHIAEQVSEHLKKLIKDGKVKYFDSWGNYKGYGAIITGRLLGAFGGELKFFAHSADSTSFLVVTQLFDVHTSNDSLGLKMIESSFKLQN
jgi:hypothetical protein